MCGIRLEAEEHRFCVVPKQSARGRTEHGYHYKFYGNLLVVEEVGTLENDTKGAFANLLSNAVVDTHHI